MEVEDEIGLEAIPLAVPFVVDFEPVGLDPGCGLT